MCVHIIYMYIYIYMCVYIYIYIHTNKTDILIYVHLLFPGFLGGLHPNPCQAAMAPPFWPGRTPDSEIWQIAIENQHLLPSGNLLHSYWKWPFIVDLPIEMVIFHSYVSLPDGRHFSSINHPKWELLMALGCNHRIWTGKSFGHRMKKVIFHYQLLHRRWKKSVRSWVQLEVWNDNCKYKPPKLAEHPASSMALLAHGWGPRGSFKKNPLAETRLQLLVIVQRTFSELPWRFHMFFFMFIPGEPCVSWSKRSLNTKIGWWSSIHS